MELVYLTVKGTVYHDREGGQQERDSGSHCIPSQEASRDEYCVLSSQSCFIQSGPLKQCCPLYSVFPPQQTHYRNSLKPVHLNQVTNAAGLRPRLSRGGDLGHASPGVPKNLDTHSETATTPRPLCAFCFSYNSPELCVGTWATRRQSRSAFCCCDNISERESQINSTGDERSPGVYRDPSWPLCPKELCAAPSSSAQSGEVRKSLGTKSLVPGNSQGNFHCTWGPSPSLGERRL